MLTDCKASRIRLEHEFAGIFRTIGNALGNDQSCLGAEEWFIGRPDWHVNGKGGADCVITRRDVFDHPCAVVAFLESKISCGLLR